VEGAQPGGNVPNETGVIEFGSLDAGRRLYRPPWPEHTSGARVPAAEHDAMKSAQCEPGFKSRPRTAGLPQTPGGRSPWANCCCALLNIASSRDPAAPDSVCRTTGFHWLFVVASVSVLLKGISQIGRDRRMAAGLLQTLRILVVGEPGRSPKAMPAAGQWPVSNRLRWPLTGRRRWCSGVPAELARISLGACADSQTRSRTTHESVADQRRGSQRERRVARNSSRVDAAVTPWSPIQLCESLGQPWKRMRPSSHGSALSLPFAVLVGFLETSCADRSRR